jgi:glutathione reductase (NADPH)
MSAHSGEWPELLLALTGLFDFSSGSAAPPGGSMPKKYDLVVIGTGTAAMTAATRVHAAGKTVAVTDFRPFGGTCALRGCDPKKMLIAGASAADHHRRMRGHGLVGDERIDWSELIGVQARFHGPCS